MKNVTNRVCQWSITNHPLGHPIGQHWPQPPLDWNALRWVNAGTMVIDVWSPTPSPHPFPPFNLPPISPPLHSNHTPHGHVTNTLPNLAFVLLYITVWIWFPIAIVHFILSLPQRNETHLAKTPFPTYHTYLVIKVTELSSHIEYECRWATDRFRQCVNYGKTHPKTSQKG